jgi:hypothetical protein
VKWFILVIVLVFDPLSICLVLAYNFLIKREEQIIVTKEIKNNEEQPPVWAVYGDSIDENIKTEEPTESTSNENTVEVQNDDYFKSHKLFKGT